MDCKEFSNLLDAWLDGLLPDGEADRLRAHAAECGDCASLYALRKDCRRLDEEIEVPDGFSSAWRQRIQEEANMDTATEKKERSFHWRRRWTGYLAAAAALVFIIGGTLISRDSLAPRSASSTVSTASSAARKAAPGSGAAYDGGAPVASLKASSGAMTNFAYSDYEVAEAEADEYELPLAAEEAAASPAKIIRTASFTLKTTAYDQDLARLQDLVSQMGGRVEYLSSWGDASAGQNRSASLTLRIPSARLDEFLEGAQQIGTVTAMTQEMEDVSDAYYDTQTRLDTQRKKLERLQELMRQAEDVSDLIDIEDAISDAQYYIDRYTGQIKSYDSRVDDSTVTVSLREITVTESEEVTLGQRIAYSLRDSLQSGLEFLEDAAVFLVAALPWLAVAAIVVAVVVLIVKKNRKNRKNKEK